MIQVGRPCKHYMCYLNYICNTHLIELLIKVW